LIAIWRTKKKFVIWLTVFGLLRASPKEGRKSIGSGPKRKWLV
jgi:hypothetical protein